MECRLQKKGLAPGSCKVRVNGESLPACMATLKQDNGGVRRLISSIHLSRPENYLSIYQSGCNFSCRKCHSWYFSKKKEGKWYTPEDILASALSYETYVTLEEPREKATAWHAHDTCICCGSCLTKGIRSEGCPRVLDPGAIALSPQGFGPVRNIVAFTGGDLTCCPEFYGRCAALIKQKTRLHLLIETNGYGLTPDNLDYLKSCGVDVFWLDIKAFDPKTHLWLTGCTNTRILELPGEIMERNFVLEVLSLYIPGLVETDEIGKIASLLAGVDPNIFFTILAFFPEYKMKAYQRPTVEEMVLAYEKVKSTGLVNVRLGNVGVFAPTIKDRTFLKGRVDPSAL